MSMHEVSDYTGHMGTCLVMQRDNTLCEHAWVIPDGSSNKVSEGFHNTTACCWWCEGSWMLKHQRDVDLDQTEMWRSWQCTRFSSTSGSSG